MYRVLIILLVTPNFQAYAQEKVILEKPKVDKRVELLSIVFRLAERPEYSSQTFKLYTDRIEQHFEKYKKHELIQFTKSVVNENYVSYDAVMRMAINLDDNLKLLSDVKDVWQQDQRWNKENVETFVTLLQKFYIDTEFDTFFNDNADLYNEAIKRYTSIYEQIDLDWFHFFYGKEPSEEFSVIIGMGFGGNYGPSLDYTNGKRTVYSIVGVGMTDDRGMPDFHPMSFIILVHEFGHSFVNYLIEKNTEEFKENGERIFSVVKDEMAKQAYGSWKTMLCEALVRASVIKYAKDHKLMIGNDLMSDFLITVEKENSFFWIEELVAELENYDKQREIYPTLESYMPKLIEAYKVWEGNIQNK